MLNFINKKNNSGITLIALVITIVVLIILAGVIITMTLGDNGIINRTKTAKKEYTNAQDYEQEFMDESEDKIDEYERIIEQYYRDGEDAYSSEYIGDFTPVIDKIECDYIKAKVPEIQSNGVAIVGYAYLLNDKVVGYTQDDGYTFDGLNFNTDYKITIIAMDEYGKIKKSNELTRRTVTGMYLYNRGPVSTGASFPIITQHSGRYTSYDISGDKIIMSGSRNTSGDQIMMKSNYIDITNYNYLSICFDCNGYHSNSFVKFGIGKDVYIIPWGGQGNETYATYLPDGQGKITTLNIANYSGDYKIFLSLAQGADTSETFNCYKIYLHN